MALPFFAAFGLMTMLVGCGSSENGGHKDSSVTDGNTPEVNALDAQVKKRSFESSIDLQPTDGNIQVDLGTDGPAVAIDTAPGSDLLVDLSVDKPLTTEVDGADAIPTGVDDGNPTEAGQGTGGTGGSTVITGTGRTGGTTDGTTGGTGGTGTSPHQGWPTTSADAPYVFGPLTCTGAAQPAPAAYTFTLNNTATTAVTFTGASFSGAPGYTVNLTAGTSENPTR